MSATMIGVGEIFVDGKTVAAERRWPMPASSR
jgi:hypothetical protein